MDKSVLEALRASKKGQIRYEKWSENGNSKEIVDNIIAELNAPTINPHLVDNWLKRNQELLSPQEDEDSTSEISLTTSSSSSSDSELVSSDVKPKPRGLSPDADQLLAQYEKMRISTLETGIEARKEMFQEFRQNLADLEQQQYMMLQRKWQVEHYRQIDEQEKDLIAKREEIKKKQVKEVEEHKSRMKALAIRMKEVEAKQKEQQCQEEKRAMERLRMQLEQILKRGHDLSTQVLSCLSTCQKVDQLQASTLQLISRIQDSFGYLSMIREESVHHINTGHLESAQRYVEDLESCLTIISSDIDEVNKKLQEVKQKAESTLVKAKETDTGASGDKKSEVTKSAKTSVEAFKVFSEIQEFALQMEQNCQELSNNPDLKKIKFELQKAVNVPINAISGCSTSHLRDKLDRLRKLLLGHPVETGNKIISTKCHPRALDFCKLTIAKKLVKQGEGQVDSNHESAFPYAAVAVGLWMEFPDLGKLILAQFYSICPYLVPYYIPRLKGQTVEDFLRTQGYLFEGDTVEKQDMFLKRMSGIARLYAAILITPAFGGKPHPHSINMAWTLLVRIIQLDPRPDITATILYNVLSVVGHSLHQYYGRQFEKLLYAISFDFFASLKNDTGGPVTRLQLFLQTAIKQGRISKPEGMVSSIFFK